MLHVVPIDDLWQHEESPDCLCGPLILEDGQLAVHRSLDGREFSEPDYRGPAMRQEILVSVTDEVPPVFRVLVKLLLTALFAVTAYAVFMALFPRLQW